MSYTEKQLGYARAIVAEGRRLGVVERGLIIGLSTALVETNLTMYSNRAVPGSLTVPYEKIGTDSKSVGLFQQQPQWWGRGDGIDLMDPTISARLFFEQLRKLNYANPARSAGKFAQDVQRSSYPDRYDARMGDATALYRLTSDAPVTSVTPTPAKETPLMGDPIWLADVLRAEGLVCDIYDGAFDRGHGDFGGIWGIIAHHTGASGNPGPGAIAKHPSLGLASQLHLDRAGKFTLCGVGIAWHAGKGAWPGIQKDNANAVTIGIEAENNGTEGWSPAQYSAYVRGSAAILRKLGHNSDRVIGHKEWAGPSQGKWDPGGIDMAAFRRDVQAAIDRTTPKQEDDVSPELEKMIRDIHGQLGVWPQLGDQTLVDAVQDVRDVLVQPIPSLINPEVAFDLPTYMRIIDAAAYRIERAVEKLIDAMGEEK